jgi:hypothetical protein
LFKKNKKNSTKNSKAENQRHRAYFLVEDNFTDSEKNNFFRIIFG